MLEIRMDKRDFYQPLALLSLIFSIIFLYIQNYILAIVFMGLFIRYFWYYDKNVNFRELYQKLKNKKSLK